MKRKLFSKFIFMATLALTSAQSEQYVVYHDAIQFVREHQYDMKIMTNVYICTFSPIKRFIVRENGVRIPIVHADVRGLLDIMNAAGSQAHDREIVLCPANMYDVVNNYRIAMTNYRNAVVGGGDNEMRTVVQNLVDEKFGQGSYVQLDMENVTNQQISFAEGLLERLTPRENNNR